MMIRPASISRAHLKDHRMFALRDKHGWPRCGSFLFDVGGTILPRWTLVYSLLDRLVGPACQARRCPFRADRAAQKCFRCIPLPRASSSCRGNRKLRQPPNKESGHLLRPGFCLPGHIKSANARTSGLDFPAWSPSPMAGKRSSEATVRWLWQKPRRVNNRGRR
jgi:hypothetical protein